MVQHVDQPEGDDAHHVRAERQQKQEEIAVVAAPDAVVDPGAVVVEVLGGNSASALGWGTGWGGAEAGPQAEQRRGQTEQRWGGVRGRVGTSRGGARAGRGAEEGRGQGWSRGEAGGRRGAGRHLHAVVADAAVGTAGRPVEAAGGAPFHAHLDALDLHGFVKGRPEVVFFVFILFSCREETFLNTRLCRNCARPGDAVTPPSRNAA